METGLQTAQAAFTLAGGLNLLHGRIDYRVNLREVLLQVALRDFKQFTLSLLQKVVDVIRLVKRLFLYFRAERNQSARQEFLSHDARMVFDMRRRSHIGCQFRDAHRTAHIVERTVGTQLLRDGKHVDGLLHHTELVDCSINFLVSRVVERLRSQQVAHNGIGIALKHQRSKHRVFNLLVLRLNLRVVGKLRLASSRLPLLRLEFAEFLVLTEITVFLGILYIVNVLHTSFFSTANVGRFNETAYFFLPRITNNLPTAFVDSLLKTS